MSDSILVPEESCPCFMGGSCPTNCIHAEDIADEDKIEGFNLANIKEILKGI